MRMTQSDSKRSSQGGTRARSRLRAWARSGRTRAIALAASLTMVVVSVVSVMSDTPNANATTLSKNGLTSAEKATCTLVEGFSFKTSPRTDEVSGDISVKKDSGTFQWKSGDTTGNEDIYGVYAWYTPAAGITSINGSIKMRWNNAVVDTSGKTWGLGISITNLRIAWNKVPARCQSWTNTSSGVSQKILGFSTKTLGIGANSSACIRAYNGKYYGVTDPWADSTHATCGVQATITMWLYGSGTIPTEKYNLFLRDIDQPNRFTANTAGSCNWTSKSPHSINWAEGIIPLDGFGSTTFHANSNSTLVADTNNCKEGNNKYSIRGSASIEDARGTMVGLGTFSNYQSPLKFVWTGSECGTGLFEDYVYRVKTAINEEKRPDASGSLVNSGKRRGGTVAVNAPGRSSANVLDGSGTKTTGDGWPGGLDMIPRNDYTVKATADAYHYIYGFYMDSTNQISASSKLKTYTGSFNNVTADHTVSVTFARGAGTLKVEKRVNPSGVSGDQTFPISVKFTDSIDANSGWNNVTKTYNLRAGESATISNIPAGVTYTVSEPTQENYTTAISPATGTVNMDQTTTAIVTNTRQEEPPKLGTLRIAKSVTNTDLVSGNPFDIQVSLTDGGGNPVSATFGDVQFSDGVATLHIMQDDYKDIPDIPENYHFSVQEIQGTGDDLNKYVTTYSNASGIIIGEETTECSVRNVYKRDTPNVVQNMRNHGTLKVAKQVAGTGADATRDFSFTVMLYDEEGEPVSGTFDGTTFENGSATFTLHDGQTKEIADIPTGYQYEIREDMTAADEARYTVGWGTTAEPDATDPGDSGGTSGSGGETQGDDGEEPQTDDTAYDPTAGGIPANDEVTVTATNTRRTGALTVGKQVTGPGAETSRNFQFTVTLTAEDGTTPVSGTFGGLAFNAQGQASFSLRHDQTKTIDGIPTRYHYAVTEAAAAGYTQSVTEGSATGTIPSDGTTPRTTITNTHTTGAVTVRKVREGNGDPTDDEFSFTIKLREGDEARGGTFGGHSFNAQSGCAFTLRGGGEETFDGLPTGWTYEVAESTHAKYATTWSGAPATGLVGAGSSQTRVVTATNTRRTGSLSVAKFVSGNAASTAKDFSFTVTLKDGGTPRGGTFGGVTFGDDGKGTFTLHHGQTKQIDGIPSGWTYEVSEAADGAYTTTWSPNPASGTIEAGSVASVTATNTRDIGNIRFHKTVAGTGAEQNRDFQFTVRLTAEDGTTPVSGTFGSLTFGSDGVASFTARHDQSLSISGIPTGYHYTITETPAYGYDPQVAQGTVSGIISSTGTLDVDLQNMHTVGDLTVKKVVEGRGDPADDEFGFTVTLRNGDSPMSGTWGNHTFNASGKCSFTLRDGGEESFPGLPSGWSYEVAEAASDRYDTTWSGDAQSGTIGVGASEARTVIATNTRKLGSLAIAKAITGTGAEADRNFQFTLALSDGGVPRGGTFGNVTFGNDGKTTFTLRGGQSKTISDIPSGWTWAVEEAPEGNYDTTWSPDPATGTIAANATTTATATNARKVGSLVVGKVATGTGADTSRRFTFTVTLTNGNTPVSGTFGGIRFGTDGKGTFTLANGETKELSGIPTGYSYSVDEATDQHYSTTWASTPASATPQVGSIAEAPVTVTATNTRVTAGITISKVTEGTGAETGRQFPFEMTLTREDGTTPASGEFGDLTFDASGKATFALANGQSKQATGIPAGYHYAIAETTPSTYVSEVTEGSLTGEMPASGGVVVTVKNTRRVGNLTIKKIRDGRGDDANDAFPFTVTLRDGSAPQAGSFGGHTFDANGQCQFTLHGDETEEFVGLPSEWSYEVTEAANGRYATTWEGAARSGAIAADTTKTVTARNTRNLGSLTVSKAIAGTGAEADRDFTFHVTLTDGGEAKSGTFGGIEFTRGVGTFTLRGGQSKTISGIPSGWDYAVAEDGVGAYRTTWSPDPATGTIASGATAMVTATNTRRTGKLVVGKQTTGTGADTSKRFTFTVTLMNGGTPVSGTFGDVEFGADGKGTFTLANGETKELSGIPTEYAYTVEEAPDDDYATSWASDQQGASPQTGTISATPANVTATNTHKTSEISVKKVVDGTGAETSRSFDFTMALTAPDGTTPVTGRFGDLTFDETGKATFSLSHDQTQTVTGVPTGTRYSVREAADSRYEASVAEGSLDGSVPTSGSASVTVKNTRRLGNLTVSKVIDGTGAETARDFSFTVTLKDGNTPKDGTFGGVTFTNGTGTFTLRGGQSKQLQDIPSEWTYAVSEEAVGTYDTTWAPDPATGAIAAGQTATVTATNTRKVGTISVTKQVDGPGAETDKDFTFTMTLTNGGQPVSGTFGGVQFGEDGKGIFSITAGQTKTLSGIPIGYSFSVEETPDADYDTAWTSEPATPTPQSGTVGTTPIAVTATNTHKSGGLTITKKVMGTGAETSRDFTFQVELRKPDGRMPVTGRFGDLTFDEQGKATATLRHGQTASLTGIPVGTRYFVSEDTDSRYTPSLTGALPSGTIASDGTIAVEFTNTRRTGSLSVTKEATGTGAETNREFAFQVTLKDGDTAQTGTFGGIEFVQGVGSFALRSGQTKTLEGIPSEWTYAVSEEAIGTYDTTWAPDPATGTIAAGQTATVKATNARRLGSIVIGKQVAGLGAETDKDFTFTVTLTNAGQPVSGTFGGVRFGEDGKGTFTLRGGQTKELSGIPIEYAYSVEETPDDSYDTAWTSEPASATPQTGSIGTAPVTVTATNTRKTGKITVSKKVAGTGAETNRSFRFTMALLAPDGRTPITGEFGNLTFDEEGKATFTLTHGQSKEADGLPVGTKYSVTEAGDSRYDASVTQGSADGTVPTSGDVGIEFTNTRRLGKLKVSKEATGTGAETDRDFTFHVTLKDGNVPQAGTFGGVEFSEGVGSFTLRSGQDRELDGIPSEWAYEVSEDAVGTYDTTWTPDPAAGTIAAGETATVKATNTRKLGKLVVGKQTVGTGAETSKKFSFTVTLTNAGQPVSGTFGGVEFGADGKGTFRLANGETRELDGIPIEYAYEVAEAADGDYDTTWASSPVSDTPQAGTIATSPRTVTATNTHRTADISVSKEVTGDGAEADRDFSFTMTLVAADGQTPVTGEFGDMTFDEDGKAAFSLRHNQTKTAEGVPVSATYRIEETPDSRYTPSVTEGSLEGTVPAGGDSVSVQVTNTRKVGNLSVKKVCDGRGDDADDEFSFTVTLKDGDTPKAGTFGGHEFDESGKCSFKLHGGETEEFVGLPSEWAYAVSEATHDRYETTWENDPRTGDIVAETTKTVTARNTRKVGDLTVQKILDGRGDDADDEFSFTVTLKDGDTPKSGEFGGHTFDESGRCSFKLHGGQAESFKDIPYDWSYEVAEAADSRYETTWEGDPAAGRIGAGESEARTVTARNTRKVGSLAITKAIAGTGAEADRDFRFTVTLKDGDTPKSGEFGDATFANGTASLTLRGGETKTIEGIPSEWTYAVSEEAVGTYDTTWDPDPATGTIEAGGQHAVTATNTRKTGRLSVSKQTIGEGSNQAKKFAFTVTITNAGQPAGGRYGDTTFGADGKATFELASGESKTIEDIPTEYAYTVDEAPAEGYIPTWNGQSGTIPEGQEGATATCTNELIRGDMRFVKVDDESHQPMPGVAFRITNKATGEAHVIVSDANGVVDTAAVAHTTNTNANDAGVSWHDGESMWVVDESVVKATNGIWFHGDQGQTTPKDDKGALPFGTYEVEELRSTANRGYRMHAKFEVTISATTKADAGQVDNTPPPPPPTMPEHGDTTTIYKDANPAPNSLVQPDGTITYALLVRNTGKDVQPRTIIRDYIPEGTTYVEDSASSGGVFVATSPAGTRYGNGRAYVEWAVDDLLPREERTVTFTVRILHAVGRYVWNTAYMSKADKTVQPGNPTNAEPTDESNTVMHRTTDYPTTLFVKTVKGSDPAPGTEVAWNSEIAYTLTVTNTNQTAAENVGVYDPVPDGTECCDLPDAYGAKLVNGDRGIGWVIPRMEPGDSVELRFTVRVTDRALVRAAGVVRNQASWGTIATSGDATPQVPTSNLENTTDIIEHPLYEAPPEDAETYKWSDPAPETTVKDGDTITYELTTTNTGAAPKPYVLVRDYIPVGTAYVDGSASDGGAYVAADAEGNATGRAYVEWLLTGVKTGDAVKKTFKVTVTEGWRSYIRNHALSQTLAEAVRPGDPDNPEPKQATNEVKHPTQPSDEDKFPLVRVTKGSDPAPGTTVAIGREITYTLDAENYSKATAYAVRVFDRVPEGTELVGAEEGSGWTASANENRSGVGWLIGEMGPGEHVTLRFTVRVTSDNVTTTSLAGRKVIRNGADWAYGNVPDDGAKVPASEEGMDNHTNIVEHPLLDPLPIQTGSQVSAYKDSDPAPNSVVEAGQGITYAITLRHTGASPQAATVVRDCIPEGTSYADGSASDGGVFVPAERSATGRAYVEWVVGEMRPGDERQLSFKVTVDEVHPTYIRNLATYSEATPTTKPGDPSNPEPPLNTNEVWHTTDESEPTPAVVQVVKSSEPVPSTKVKVGETIAYTLHVTNTGGSTATNWGVHDALYEGLELVRDSVGGDHHGTVAKDGRSVAWVVERLAPGESVDLTFSVKVATRDIKDDVIRNQATWGRRSGPDDVPDGPQDNTSNIVEHPLGRDPKPVIEKVAITKNAVRTGQTVEFLVTVRNDGDADIVDHVLIDTPGDGLEYLSDNKGGTKEGKNGRWNGITLKPGEKFEVKVTCKVTATKPGRLRNIATLYQPDGKKLVALANAEAYVMVMVAADLIQTGVTVGALASGIATAALAAWAARRRRAA